LGAGFESSVTKHLFIGHNSLIIFADYVTTDARTRFIDPAPIRNVDDYVTGVKYALPPYCLIKDKHCYIDDGQIWAAFVSVSVLDIGRSCKANQVVLERLKKENALFALKSCVHQYLHCWRSGTLVIFRSMDRWFLALDEYGTCERV
jgi:isoleucyl-tRNA synthetase